MPPKIVILTAAVRDSGGKEVDFIVFEGQRQPERSIKTGNSTSRGVEVAEGLIGGEEIVLSSGL